MDGEKVIIPKDLQMKIVKELHQDTHGSFGRMKDMIQQSMIWKGWKKTIQDEVDRCEACKTW